jgi:iron complex outermembrane receptor protein
MIKGRSKIYLLLFACVCFSFFSKAQNLIIQGKITDIITDKSLQMASILLDKGERQFTDSAGFFRFKTQPGKHLLRVSKIGYRLYERNLNEEDFGIRNFNIELEPFQNQLDQFVISGSREEKKIAREITSVSIIKPYLIDNTASQDLSQVINRIPGIQVVDGQATIRGGVGFSYNTGSKVSVLLDDMPLLGADLGDVRWRFLPIEGAEQIEVIKGSASVLYGSSALNGTVNVRTGWPSKKPQTKIQFYQGVMQNFERSYINWWDSIAGKPNSTGLAFSHKQAWGNFDLVLSGNITSINSHLQYNDEHRIRTYIKTRYRPKSIPNLSFGLNANIMLDYSGSYFLWQNADTGTLKQYNGTKPIVNLNQIISIDPHLDYKHGKMTHALKFRFYQIRRIIDKTKFPDMDDAIANLYALDYNNRFKFNPHFSLNSGIYSTTMWSVGNVYKGSFAGGSAAIYSQLEYNYKRFTFILGGRYEYLVTDTIPNTTGLLKRIGINYQLAERTFIRSNYNEGYRVPTIGEKYVSDRVSTLNVLPNPSLVPEKGWTAELGIQQGFRIGNFIASADFAMFIQQYDSMIDFKFDQWIKPSYYFDPNTGQIVVTDGVIGFKAQNVGKTRAAGFEFSLTGEGKIKNVMIRTIAGYTYTLPVNISSDTKLDDPGFYFDKFVKSFGTAKIDSGSYLYNVLLPYRNRSIGKVDIEAEYRKYSLGYSMFYYSIYEKIDNLVAVLPGVKSFFERAGTGDYVHNIRFNYYPNQNLSLGILVNNITNREYASRPGKMDPARTFIVQVRYKF